jgi:uncharacterized membrane protein
LTRDFWVLIFHSVIGKWFKRPYFIYVYVLGCDAWHLVNLEALPGVYKGFWIMISGIAAILGLVMVILAKFYTTAQIQRLRRMVAEAQADNSKMKTALRVAESTKAVAVQNLKTEERIQRTLKLQIEKNTRKLAEMTKK